MNRSHNHLYPDGQPLSAAGAETGTPEGISFGDILRAISNGKWFILVSGILCFGASVVYISVTKPVYQASGTVRIDPSRSGSLGLTDAVLGSDSNAIPTEIAIIGSDRVALAALETLTPEQFQSFEGFPKSKMVFALENADHTPTRLSPMQEGAIGALTGGLKAKQVDGTQMVGITFKSHNPEMAALLINRVVDAYLRQTFDSKYNSVVQVRGWLSQQMDDLQKRAADSQRRLAEFQEKNNLVGTDPSNNTVVDRLKLLNARVTEAEGDRILKEAQLQAAMSGDPAVLATLLPDPNLEALQTSEANLYAQFVQLSTKFGPNYPPLAEVRQQLASTREAIKQNVGVITNHLRQDFGASKQAEDMLRKDYEAEVTRAYALNRVQADYAVLAAEGASSRNLYDTLQFKLQQATVNAGLDAINTMIVDRARPPLSPIEPKRTLILLSGLILGLAAGVGAALLQEALGGEIHSISQVESGTGLVNLATVPHLDFATKTGIQKSRSRLITLFEPRSRAAEAYRTLRNSVLLSSIDKPPCLILISSSIPGEGKSSTSANYAVVLAQAGGRVLLVDADLRRPTLHTIFGVSNLQGLSNWLIGQSGAENIIVPVEELPNLHFLPAGQQSTFSSESLASSKFHTLLEQWERDYDTVLVDSAPLLTVSDSLPLASWADSIILVARAGHTPLKALIRTKAILIRAHARIAGVLLNDISNAGEDSGYYGKGGYDYYN